MSTVGVRFPSSRPISDVFVCLCQPYCFFYEFCLVCLSLQAQKTCFLFEMCLFLSHIVFYGCFFFLNGVLSEFCLCDKQTGMICV